MASRVLVSEWIGKTSTPNILDMCAAPGGKTTHIAALLKGKCNILACDRSRKRALKLAAVCCKFEQDMGYSKCIECSHVDITKSVIDSTGNPSLMAKVNDGDMARRVWKRTKHCLYEARKEIKRMKKATSTKLSEAHFRGEITKEEYESLQSSQFATINQEAVLNYLKQLIAANPDLEASQAIQQAITATRDNAAALPSEKPVEGNKLVAPRGLSIESFDAILLDGPCSALGLRPRLAAFDKHLTRQGLEAAARYQRNIMDTAFDLLKVNGVLVYSTCTINPLENEGNVEYFLQKFSGRVKLEKQSPHIGSQGLTGFNCDAALLQRFDPRDVGSDTTGFFCAKFRKIKR